MRNPVRSYHYKIEATDDRGVSRLREIIVIAKTETEALEEIADVVEMHEVFDSWRVTEVLGVKDLKSNDSSVGDYENKGAHSFYQPL